MKIYRIAALPLTIDISMPDALFWLFKRFAKIKTYEDKTLHGNSFDYIVFDELKEKK